MAHDSLTAALVAEDTEQRAEALSRLHRFDLADVATFTAVLRAIGDVRPLPARFAPKTVADPFAAFFGEGPAKPIPTLGQFAADQMEAAGWPGERVIVDAVAAVLDEQPSELLGNVCVRQLGATTWDDEVYALANLVPRLHRLELPLYPVIARQGPEGVAILVASALHPYRSRAVNELLSLGNAHDAMLDALCDAVVTRNVAPNGLQAMAILAQLVAWAGERAPAVAASLEDRFPWAVSFAAFDDPAAQGRMREWLKRKEWPEALPERLDEALRARTLIEGYPLLEWLRACDGGCTVISAWGNAKEAAELLQEWVRVGFGSERHAERAAEAAVLLAGCGEAGPVAAEIARLVADPALEDRWTAEGLNALTAARPAGLAEAIAARLVRAPKQAGSLIHAFLACEPAADLLRQTTEALVVYAEQAPVVRKAARRGGVSVTREGIDTPALKPLIEAVGDSVLSERLTGVLPYLGA